MTIVQTHIPISEQREQCRSDTYPRVRQSAEHTRESGRPAGRQLVHSTPLHHTTMPSPRTCGMAARMMLLQQVYSWDSQLICLPAGNHCSLHRQHH